MKDKYFNLIQNKTATSLSIVIKDTFDCSLMNKDTGEVFDGFLLAETPTGSSKTICDIEFNKSTTDNKYQARLTFRKTDKNLLDKKLRVDVDHIRIPFSNGQEGYRNFWKMIAFLYKWKKDIDLGEFDDYFSVTDKSFPHIFDLLSKSENKEVAINNLLKLSSKSFSNIENLVSTTKLKSILAEWEQNKNNGKEVQFWQKFFKTHHWILPQIFATNVTLMGDEFYVGGQIQGKRKGAKFVDFVTKNSINKTISLIEIKTPQKTLIKKQEYDSREGIYPISSELSGAISQVLNQKDIVQKDFKFGNDKKDYKVLNPRCILLIGSKKIEKMNDDQENCFELFRNSQRDVEIITFDELFSRIKSILDIFEQSEEQENTTTTDSAELPF